MITNSSITQINLNKDEELKVVKKKTELKPHFTMIGSGRMSNNMGSVDLLVEMSKMNVSESYAFLSLRDSITWNNEAREYNYIIQHSQVSMTKYQKKLFQVGIPMLLAKDLVRRVRRGQYIIHPSAIIPSNYTESLNIWNSTAGSLNAE